MNKEKLILIVDDDAELCLRMLEILTPEGYRVVTAENGKIGLEMARVHQPGVILLDVMMPVMDGYEFLAAQSEDAAIAKIPVIILSGGVRLERIPRDIPRLPKPPELLVLFALIESKLKPAYNPDFVSIDSSISESIAPTPSPTSVAL